MKINDTEKMKRTLIILGILFNIIHLQCQEIADVQQNSLKVTSPTAFLFMKFGEIPISEYTGSPSIEIPVYTIALKGFALPIKLRYNSKGIRVSEESDWVGLGWDLSFGSICQIVNDKEDLGGVDSPGDVKQNILSYSYRTFPYELWFKEFDTSPPSFQTMSIDHENDDYGADQTYSVITYIKSMTNKGWLTEIDFGNLNTTDFEKDIFIADVLGERLYIIIKKNGGSSAFNGYTYKVLNKVGYKIACEKNNNYDSYKWSITTPEGLICEYNEQNNTLTRTTSYNSITSNTTSRIWQISKITTIYGQTISFNYSDQKTLTNYQSIQQWKLANNISTTKIDCRDSRGDTYPGPYYGFLTNSGPIYEGRAGLPSYLWSAKDGDKLNYIVNSGIQQDQKRSYISSITYNGTTIKFDTSDRTDWKNSLKIDSISILNANSDIVNKIMFKYGLYKSSKDSRLRLDSLVLKDDEKYIFTYDTTQLPDKWSYAVDYWGYYNGQNQNTSYIPDILGFDYNVSGYTSLSLNSNKNIKYSINEYCKAGILQKIQYPTGSILEFCYSLNSYNNFKTPIAPVYNLSNTYYGNGLKVDSIKFYKKDGSLTSKMFYQYEQGKLLLPLRFFFQKNETYVEVNRGISLATEYKIYDVLNVCTSNSYISDPLGDGNCVGYGKVTSWKVNAFTGLPDNGKTVHYFRNQPNIIYRMTNEYTNTFPSYHKGIQNGSLLEEYIYDANNRLITKSINNYYVRIINKDDDIEYNSRASYLGQWGDGDGYRKMLVSYYPLVKDDIALRSKQITKYFGSDSITTTESYNYNSNNAISSINKSTSNSFQGESEIYYYPEDIKNNSNYSVSQRAIMSTLITSNRINEKIRIESSKYTNGKASTKTQYAEYDAASLLPSNINTSLGTAPLETSISLKYDQYKNVVEKTERNNVPTTYLWGYNSLYPIAEIKNATYSQVSSALQGTTPEQLASSESPDISKVDALRTVLSSALVTTYSYKPLVGITNIANTRLLSTKYAYDKQNRLNLIRDNNLSILEKYRYAYSGMTEINSTNFNFHTGTVVANTTYYNINTKASALVSGGSGNFQYDWSIQNSTGAVVFSGANAGPVFNYILTSIGSFTILCQITDIVTNNSITIKNNGNCIYKPLTINIFTSSETFSSVASTGISAASTYTASSQCSGGSGNLNYGYCVWSFIDNSGKTLQTATISPTSPFSFICTKSGNMTIKCTYVDNPSGLNLTTTKTITVI